MQPIINLSFLLIITFLKISLIRSFDLDSFMSSFEQGILESEKKPGLSGQSSFKITKDRNSNYWTVGIKTRKDANERPMLILPYSRESWISATDVPNKNIKGMECDEAHACKIIQVESPNTNAKTIKLLNYTIEGVMAAMKPYSDAGCNVSNITLVDLKSLGEKAPNINPPVKVNGGLGLGIREDQLTKKETISFVESFAGTSSLIIGIYLSHNDFDVTSEMIIGAYNPSVIDRKYPLTKIKVTDSTTWSLQLDSIEDEFENSYKIHSKTDTIRPLKPSMVIFDPNVELIGVPGDLYDDFIEDLTANNEMKCGILIPQKFPRCECKENNKFPNLFLSFSGTLLTIPPDLYVQRQGDLCILLFGSTQEIGVLPEFKGNWVFGAPVMSYFYTIFEYNAGKSTVTLAKALGFERNTKFLIIVGSASGFIGLIGLIVCAILLRGQSRDSEEEKKPILEPVSPKEERLGSYQEFDRQRPILAKRVDSINF